ncbi:hypothetical protein OTU49_000405, partial [Cherax quadricarinatus]
LRDSCPPEEDTEWPSNSSFATCMDPAPAEAVLMPPGSGVMWGRRQEHVGGALLILSFLGAAEAETLPTLTLQPLTYFTLPPPPAYTSVTFPSGPSTPLPSSSMSLSGSSEASMTQESAQEEEVSEEVREPYFATLNTSVSVFLGAETTLDCTIHDTANLSVAWLRRVDDMLELLTWDSHTYTKDQRYSLVPSSGDRWQQWQLVIRDTQLEDQGQYRCQLATEPPMMLAVTLNVIAPRARVVDERGTEVQEKHYKSGSMIELTCLIEQVPFPHDPVTWRRGTTVLTYNTSRGGISVKGEPDAGYIRSRLYVADAAPADSGVYSCWYCNYTSDTVTVHVLAGENSAAMQHDTQPETSSQHPATSTSSATWLTNNLYLLAASCFATCTATCHGIITFSSSSSSSYSSCSIWKIATAVIVAFRSLVPTCVSATCEVFTTLFLVGIRMVQVLAIWITTYQGVSCWDSLRMGVFETWNDHRWVLQTAHQGGSKTSTGMWKQGDSRDGSRNDSRNGSRNDSRECSKDDTGNDSRDGSKDDSRNGSRDGSMGGCRDGSRDGSRNRGTSSTR